MDKISVSRRILGSAVVITGLVLGLIAPAQAAAPLTLTDIYSTTKILRVDLTLPTSSVSSLNNSQTFRVYVPGTVALKLGTKTSGDLDINIRLKGSTSMFSLNETPSFKIKFKKNGGLGYLGLRRMTLNAMTQDGSKVHEFAAYSLFNAMSLSAPKTGWVHLYINGVDRGLYVNIEQPDQVFSSKRFKDITQHVYEGIYSQDVGYGSASGGADSGSFLADYGWKVTPNKNDLSYLITYANDPKQLTWYRGLNQVFNRTALIKFFAVENFIGHWDGYSGPDINNYYLRSSTQNKFTFIPWGTDQTFGENRATPVVGDDFFLPMLSNRADHPWANNLQRGKLYVTCINYLPCKTEYLKDLKAVSAKVTSMLLTTKINTAVQLINTVADPQNSNSSVNLKALHTEQARTVRWILTRQAQVADLLKQNGIK
jgi:spore coat protein CotH